MLPDLELHVSIDDANRLTYDLRFAPGKGGHFKRRIAGPTILRRPDEYQEMVMARLERLRKGVGADNSAYGSDEVNREIASLGQDLYQELFPPELQDAYRNFRDEVTTLLIVSDEPWIPWEIVKPYQPGGGGGFEDDFLCIQFELTRWLADSAPLLTEIIARRFAIIEAADTGHGPKLLSSGEEIKHLRRLCKDNNVAEPEVLSGATHSDTRKLIERGGHDVLHFIGHGEFHAADPSESGFHLVDGRPFRPRDIHGQAQGRIREDRPLVFFNSCQISRQGIALTRIGGWATRWVRDAGCGVFIGPQWNVKDGLASLFSRSFFAALEAGRTFGAAAKFARQEVRKEAYRNSDTDLSWLAYTVYAHPNGVLVLGRRDADSAQSPFKEIPQVERYRTDLNLSRGDEASRREQAAKRSRSFLIASMTTFLLALSFGWFVFQQVDTWPWQERSDQPNLQGPPEPKEELPGDDETTVHQPKNESFELITGVSPTSSVIDVHAYQKPPYDQRSVYLHTQIPTAGIRDPLVWRSKIEHAVETKLGTAGLGLTWTTNAAWLIVLNFSAPRISEGKTWPVCDVQADLEIYHERQRRNKRELFSETGGQPREDAACLAAVHKIAERVGDRIRSAAVDNDFKEN